MCQVGLRTGLNYLQRLILGLGLGLGCKLVRSSLLGTVQDNTSNSSNITVSLKQSTVRTKTKPGSVRCPSTKCKHALTL